MCRNYEDSTIILLSLIFLHMSTQDTRWKQRHENFTKAFNRLKQAVVAIESQPYNDLYQIALIGTFQFTFELAWKTLKDYLKYQGIQAHMPRDVIKQAFHFQLIQNGQTWIDMLEDGNLMAHVYQEDKAQQAALSIQCIYVSAITQVHTLLAEKL